MATSNNTTTAQDAARDLVEIYTTASLQSMEHLALVTNGIEYLNVGDLGVTAAELTEEVCERMLTKPPSASVTGPIGNLFKATTVQYWDKLETPSLQDIVDTANLIGRDIFRAGTSEATPIHWATVKRICQGNNKIVERHNAGDEALQDVDIMAFFQDVTAARAREKGEGVKYRNAKGNQDQKAEIVGAIVAAGYGEHLTDDDRQVATDSRGAMGNSSDPDHQWLVAVEILKGCCEGSVPVIKDNAFIAEMNALAGYLETFKSGLKISAPVVATV